MTYLTTGVAYASSANSTTSNLTSGSTFTGTFENITIYPAVELNIFSDKSSATDGIELQFSHDGTTVDFVIKDSYFSSTQFTKVFATQGKFFRLKYTNGSATTTDIRINIIHRTIYTPKHIGNGNSLLRSEEHHV